eukprot:5535369-Prymnesium_polylepis.1
MPAARRARAQRAAWGRPRIRPGSSIPQGSRHCGRSTGRRTRAPTRRPPPSPRDQRTPRHASGAVADGAPSRASPSCEPQPRTALPPHATRHSLRAPPSLGVVVV